MKTFINLLFISALLLSHGVLAESDNRAELEMPVLSIKLSQDGTGIIKNVSCSECDFNFVKVTPGTEAFVNGVKVDILRTADRAGKDVFLVFDSKTAEVRAIRWSE